jgi:hypothetical protein
MLESAGSRRFPQDRGGSLSGCGRAPVRGRTSSAGRLAPGLQAPHLCLIFRDSDDRFPAAHGEDKAARSR